MLIEVVINDGEPPVKRGNLLEKIGKEFLETHDYVVEQQIRNTGVELDLLCRGKANPAKKIYVECKAYGDGNNIPADAITKLVGIRDIKNYTEAWLIATSGLSKDAKGLIDEIESSDKAANFTFYTPEKLIQALIKARLIEPPEAAKKILLGTVKNPNRLGDAVLLITEFGYFWAIKYISDAGKTVGILITYAKNNEVVLSRELLGKLAATDSTLNRLDFNIIFTFGSSEVNNVPVTVSLENLKLNGEYLTRINDVGARLHHPDKDALTLDDVFVYQDLQNVEEEDSPKVNSKELLLLTPGQGNRYLIFGEELSGKTSLAYNLQKNINSGGIIATYVGGEEIKSSDFGKFSNLLVRNFQKQYNEQGTYAEEFRRLFIEDPSAILVIIDDYDSLGIKSAAGKSNFFAMLNKYFPNVYIFANESVEIEIMADSATKEMLKGFNIFRIQQFGHVLRDDLIEKWLTVNGAETISDKELLEKKAEISGKIGIAVGTNFVPTFPLFLLTMLQLIESGAKQKLEGSSYAELYRYLIDQALGIVGVRPEDLDFYHAYLSFVAHQLFVSRKKEFTEGEMVKIYEDYSKIMDIEKPFGSVHSVIIKAKIFKNESTNYSFNHNYAYYFFAAKYLAENIEQEAVKVEIGFMMGKLYLTEIANIILFLIHHSKNKEIIEKIISEADKLFSQIAPFGLSDEEVSKINSLVQEELTLSFEDKDHAEYRRKQLEEKDRAETEGSKKEEGSESTKNVSDLNLFERINLAFKLIEILGQIANNYYGSLNAEVKVRILENACQLGFKSLRALIEDFEKYTDNIKQSIVEAIDKKGGTSKETKEQIADRIIFAFMEMVSFTFLKRISNSIASRNLFITITRITTQSHTPANQLIDIATRLNFPNELKINSVVEVDRELNKNPLARRLLRFLVIEHLYKFDVQFSDRQSICDRLGIKYLPGRMPSKKKGLQDNN